jgi:hypothetical protein
VLRNNIYLNKVMANEPLPHILEYVKRNQLLVLADLFQNFLAYRANTRRLTSLPLKKAVQLGPGRAECVFPHGSLLFFFIPRQKRAHLPSFFFFFFFFLFSVDIQSTQPRYSTQVSGTFRTRTQEQGTSLRTRITSTHHTPHAHATRNGIQSHRQFGRWQEAAGQNHTHHDSASNRQQCLREAGLCRATVLWPQVIVLLLCCSCGMGICKVHAHPVFVVLRLLSILLIFY